MDNNAVKALSQFSDAALGLAAALKPFIVAFGDFGRTIYEMVWSTYLKAGAPYGETQKGLERWLNEQKSTHPQIH